jgi:Raf kinase inhibitor-like YbhB/YbcL family protein
VSLAVSLGACSNDGRDLRPPALGQTIPPSSTSSSQPPIGSLSGSAPSGSLSMSSPAVGPGGVLPDVYTCLGRNVSPPLTWTGVPAGTAELAVTMTDDDANGFVHWVVAGLDPALTGLAEGTLPEGAVQSANDAKSVGWFGPCPPNDETHRYTLSVYALPQASGLESGADPLEAVATVAGLASTHARMTVIFPAP